MVMKHLSIDIETFSDVDLLSSGVWPYAESPNFEILLFAYAWDFGKVQLVETACGEVVPPDVVAALDDPNVIKHAYNAPFEIKCLQEAGFGTCAKQWACTMHHALYCGYAAGLAKTGDAIGLPADLQKDRNGAALIRYFSIPCKPTSRNGNRTRNLPKHDPEKWRLFGEYCKQDVVAEMEILKRLMVWPVPGKEKDLWNLEQSMHKYGIGVDQELVAGALAIRERSADEMLQEAADITQLDNPNSRDQLKGWLEQQTGQELANLTKDTVKGLMDTSDSHQVRRVLELRQSLSKASLKKYDAFRDASSRDGRIHGAHQIYGANRTGRWAGRIIQPQNMPRDTVPETDLARSLVKEKNLGALRWVYGSSAVALSALLRTVIVPSNGRKLIVADFSAIEARIIAWLANETWVMEVFAGDGRIYEATAARMFHVPVDRIRKGNPEYSLRQKGKVATLALGYQGGPGALKQMGALAMGLSEEELPELVSLWRQANPNIVKLWYAFEEAAIDTIHSCEPNTVRGITFRRETDLKYGQDFLTVELPSGRKLFYLKPWLTDGMYGPQIKYLNAAGSGMIPTDTYGGKLCENVVQAIARDCLAESLLRLDSAEYKTIMHVHDEVVVDADLDDSVEEVCDLMGQPIDWAPGLILTADGFECEYYRKE